MSDQVERPPARYGEFQLRRILHIVDRSEGRTLCKHYERLTGTHLIGAYPEILAYCKDCMASLIERTA